MFAQFCNCALSLLRLDLHYLAEKLQLKNIGTSSVLFGTYLYRGTAELNTLPNHPVSIATLLFRPTASAAVAAPSPRRGQRPVAPLEHQAARHVVRRGQDRGQGARCTTAAAAARVPLAGERRRVRQQRAVPHLESPLDRLVPKGGLEEERERESRSDESWML